MVKKSWVVGLVLLTLTGCHSAYAETATSEPEMEMETTTVAQEFKKQIDDFVTEGTESYRDFVVDSVLHSDAAGDIHYCVSIPDE